METEFDPTRECGASISGACYWMFQGFRECDEMCAEHPEYKPKIIGAIWGNKKEEVEEEDDWQSPDHEGPCCGSCDWEWAYTDIGMRNFGFGCCCKTEAI